MISVQLAQQKRPRTCLSKNCPSTVKSRQEIWKGKEPPLNILAGLLVETASKPPFARKQLIKHYQLLAALADASSHQIVHTYHNFMVIMLVLSVVVFDERPWLVMCFPH